MIWIQYKEMREKKILPNSFTFITLLKACAETFDLARLEFVLQQMESMHYKKYPIEILELIASIYNQTKASEKAWELWTKYYVKQSFNGLSNFLLYNLIELFVAEGDLDKVLQIIETCHARTFRLNSRDYGKVLSLLVAKTDLQTMENYLKQWEIPPDIIYLNYLLGIYKQEDNRQKVDFLM